MSRSSLFLRGAAILLSLLFSSMAQAFVSSGNSCVGGCHGANDAGRAAITSSLTTNTTDNPGVPAGLKLFEANPDKTKGEQDEGGLRQVSSRKENAM